jgi:hypothetical protein
MRSTRWARGPPRAGRGSVRRRRRRPAPDRRCHAPSSANLSRVSAGIGPVAMSPLRTMASTAAASMSSRTALSAGRVAVNVGQHRDPHQKDTFRFRSTFSPRSTRLPAWSRPRPQRCNATAPVWTALRCYALADEKEEKCRTTSSSTPARPGRSSLERGPVAVDRHQPDDLRPTSSARAVYRSRLAKSTGLALVLSAGSAEEAEPCPMPAPRPRRSRS